MQYSGALPRHLNEHQEMLLQALLQEYKARAKSKGSVANDDGISISATSLEGSRIAALTVINQSS